LFFSIKDNNFNNESIRLFYETLKIIYQDFEKHKTFNKLFCNKMNLKDILNKIYTSKSKLINKINNLNSKVLFKLKLNNKYTNSKVVNLQINNKIVRDSSIIRELINRNKSNNSNTSLELTIPYSINNLKESITLITDYDYNQKIYNDENFDFFRSLNNIQLIDIFIISHFLDLQNLENKLVYFIINKIIDYNESQLIRFFNKE